VNTYQQQVLSDIIAAIFTWEKKFHQKEIDDVIARNIELLGPGTAHGFIYGVKWYASSKIGVLTSRKNQSLHPSLHPVMARIVNHQATVLNDELIIRQVLGKLISSCNTRAEMRSELPEICIEVEPSIWQFDKRTHEPAQSIKNNPLAMSQYERVVGKIHQYAAMRYML
jgi:hypothetical protein